MKIELKGVYRTRDGDRVVIVKNDASSRPFYGSNNHWYLKTGHVSVSSSNSADLVSKWVDKPDVLRLKIGETYRTRDGRRAHVTAIDRLALPAFQYSGTIDGETPVITWHENGRFNYHSIELDGWDLVSIWDENSSTVQACAPTTESELDRLVRIANEGADAHHQLFKKYPREYEVARESSSGALQLWAQDFLYAIRARVKPSPPKPQFQSVQTQHGEATLSDDGKTLKIGCQTWDASMLQQALRHLCNGGQTFDRPAPHNTFSATRAGIHSFHGSVTWDEADRLLAALDAFFADTKEGK